MSELSRPPEWDSDDAHLVGEPVTRPDGSIVLLKSLPDGFLFIDSGDAVSGFTHDDVVIIGNGSYKDGIVRIGQEFYKAGSKGTLDADLAFQEELNRHYVPN